MIINSYLWSSELRLWDRWDTTLLEPDQLFIPIGLNWDNLDPHCVLADGVYSPHNLSCHVRLGSDKQNGGPQADKISSEVEIWNSLRVLVCLQPSYRFPFVHCRVLLSLMFSMWLFAWFQMSDGICAAALWLLHSPLSFLIHDSVCQEDW